MDREKRAGASVETLLRVGELAERAGLTVRTLHHYDEIGLLSPERRTRAGYRLYGGEDLERLTRILLLKSLGLSLEEIGRMLEGDSSSLTEVLGLQIERLRRDLDRQRRLLDRLERLAAQTAVGEVSTGDFLETLEMLNLHEKHFTPEQLETLEQRREALGEDHIREVEAEWPRLIAEMRAAMERGDDPASPEVQRLSACWQELVAQFTGGDPKMAASVRKLYEEEPAARQQTGLDPELMEYVGRAAAAGRSEA